MTEDPTDDLNDSLPDPGRFPSAEEIAASLAASPVVAVRRTRHARARPAPADVPPVPADPGPPSDGSPPDTPPPRGPARPRGEIWKDCPVTALGVNGEFSWYLDRHGQLRGVKKHEAQTILHLFGDRIELLCLHFPQFEKDGGRKPNRFDQTSASMAMIAACSERGLFNPDGAVRGVGAWADDDGALVYHTGQQLLTAEGARDPAALDGHIYPAYPPIAAPATTAGAGDVAAELLQLLQSWAWASDVAPMLALGMVGVQMLGGALSWRPAFWVTGDKATGKSTFQDLLKHLHGPGGLVQTADATKSGITARLGHSSLPVAIDEIEPGEEGGARERDIITLARVASSGGQWVRGTADQKGAGGNVFSTFMFSSILISGALGPQDRSRLIVLALEALDREAPRLTLDPRSWRARGARLKRLLIDRWPDYARRLGAWRESLFEHGLGGRSGDNYATTLAMADLALSAEAMGAAARDDWARRVAFAARGAEADIGSDAEDMLMHLIGQPLDPWRRGEQFTVAQWLMAAGALPGAPAALRSLLYPGEMLDETDSRMAAGRAANEILAKYGLRVRREAGVEVPELFLANAPIPGLARLFEHSRWARGVWAQSARRVPGARLTPHPLCLAGQRSRGALIPFRAIAGLMAFPMDTAEPAPTDAADLDLDDFA